MKQPSLDRASRVRIASFLYKLAIRIQKTSKVGITDPEKVRGVIEAVDGATNKSLSGLSSHFTPSIGFQRGKVPTLHRVFLNRTFVPGYGSGIRSSFVFGPLHLVQSEEGIGVLTNMSTKNTSSFGGLENPDALKAVFESRLGGVKSGFSLSTEDVRGDTRFKVEKGFREGKPVWKIIDKSTGNVASYEASATVKRMTRKKDKRDKDVDVDPYRDAIFSTIEEAAEVWNSLEGGVGTMVIPEFRETIAYVKYTAVYLESHSTTDVGAPIYEVFNRLIPREEQERSMEMDRRLEEYDRAEEAKRQQAIQDAEDLLQKQRERLFKQNQGKRRK
jgi:hypothetical protein